MPTQEELEVISPQELKKYQEERMRHILHYAYRHATAIKDKMQRAGVGPEDVKTLTDLEKVPITRKEDLVALQKASPPFGGLCTRKVEELERVLERAEGAGANVERNESHALVPDPSGNTVALRVAS